jgi:alginate O-acetyltransferase complex protein AlgI
MLFDSPIYLLFLALTVALYWRMGFRQQNLFLLAGSWFFYGWWDWRFLGLMVASTTLDYHLGRRIADLPDGPRRKGLLVASLAVNFTVLGFFKYFNFFLDSTAGLLANLGLGAVPLPLLTILLPPGISFYTFQEVAYIVDVYQRKLEPARDFTSYALFVSFFPHLIAGPIQRPGHLLPQTLHERHWDSDKAFEGVMLIIEGLFRKCVIADNCALLANGAFAGHFGEHNGWLTLLGMYAFAWQIYGDFSGYSNIARGSAQLLGFHFMVNFRQPYLSESLQEFWRRWHISLSTWLRDYLYIGLGGNRLGEWKTYRNLLLTMLLGGLWHGANWTFVVWGALHGLGLAIERYLAPGPAQNEAQRWARRVFYFHLVGVAWVFFRAQSVGEALRFLGGLGAWSMASFPAAAFGLLAVYSVPLYLLDLNLERGGVERECAGQGNRMPLRLAMAGLLLVAWALGGASEANAFLYFQF